MPGIASVSAKRADRTAARAAAYRTDVNPFAEGTRLHRYFEKALQHRLNMDAVFRDLEEVYGPIGVRRTA